MLEASDNRLTYYRGNQKTGNDVFTFPVNFLSFSQQVTS